MEVQVITHSTHVIRPASPTPPQHARHLLSNFEQLFPLRQDSCIYFYKPSYRDTEIICQKLRDSLSKLLVYLPCLAGKFINVDGRWEVHCDDSGARITTAEVAARLDVLQHPSCCPFMAQLVPQPELVPQTAATSDVFPLDIKLTRFQCGGLSLGVATCHILMDGTSLSYTMRLWSQFARGYIPPKPPFYNRTTLIKARRPPQVNVPIPEYQDYSHADTSQADSALLASSSDSTWHTFRFTEEKLQQLRSDCNINIRPLGLVFSKFEALAAHLWRSVVQAQACPAAAKTCCLLIASFRDSVLPLPRDLLTNCSVTALPEAMAGDVRSKPLSWTAGLMHNSLVEVTRENIQSRVDFLEEALRPGRSVRLAETARAGSTLSVTHWGSLPLYESSDLEFGGVATYVHVRPPMHQNSAVILPTPFSHLEYDVSINLGKAHMAKLRQDPCFANPVATSRL